jgi:HEAT repeat protein
VEKLAAPLAEIRRQAALALGALGAVEAADALEALALDGDVEVRKAAGQALDAIAAGT